MVHLYETCLVYWLEEEGVGSVCHGILLYVKLLWCMGLPWVYVHCVLCETSGCKGVQIYGQWRCNGVAWIYGQLAGGRCNRSIGLSIMGICAFCNL